MGAKRGLSEPALAFRVDTDEDVACAVRVNFGLYAGRNATQAEIDDLARALSDVVDSFTIVAEERHEFGDAVEAAIRQTVIEVPEPCPSDDLDELCDRVVTCAESWAAGCIRSRSELGELGSEI
jgi:hypothetical protein